MLVNGQFMPNTNGKLVDKNGKEIFPIETGTVPSSLGTITYVKRGKIVIYTVNFNAYNTGATTSELATAPYFNPNMQFMGGAIMRVGNVPVNFAAINVNIEGKIRALHMNYSEQVELIGSVTVILE